MEEINLEPNDYLELNAKLQQKKRALRKALKKKGVLKRGGKNEYDKYSYFSEAQYKELFTVLFSDFGLELKFTELGYDRFTGEGKQTNGRMLRLMFTLMDTDTGFGEETIITGEGMDKGDKAMDKAYTGAMKYYLANTFLVATGDDPEKDSPEQDMNQKQVRKASPKQVAILAGRYTGENLDKLLSMNGIDRLEDLPMDKASELITKLTR